LIANPGKAVVLSSNPAVTPNNYPVPAIRDAFLANAAGNLALGGGRTRYTATAELLSMRQIIDSFKGVTVTLQTWRIRGTGTVAGVGEAAVEVSAVLETQSKPVFDYGFFATGDGCGAITLKGNVQIDSYDSRIANSWNNPSNWGAKAGTNGNANGNSANTSIGGTLDTPNSGVGNCSEGGVTAVSGSLTVTGGLTKLAQPITFPTPPAPSPAPPTTNFDFNGNCPSGTLYCTVVSGNPTISPPTSTTVVSLGNVSGTVHVSAGIYNVNSIDMGNKGQLIVDGPGPVIINVAGTGVNTPVDVGAQAFLNPTYDASKLQILYGGDKPISLGGGSRMAATVLAPNADVEMKGGGDFYGAVIAKTLRNNGNFSLHFDRALGTRNVAITAGNPVLQQFSWSNF
jgi:hypothetical protein